MALGSVGKTFRSMNLNICLNEVVLGSLATPPNARLQKQARRPLDTQEVLYGPWLHNNYS